MATAKHTRRPARTSPSRAKSRKPLSPIQYVRGKGLIVSTEASWPRNTSDKVVVAYSIVQAVVAAGDARINENYPIHWPLGLVMELLEQAAQQINAERLGRRS